MFGITGSFLNVVAPTVQNWLETHGEQDLVQIPATRFEHYIIPKGLYVWPILAAPVPTGIYWLNRGTIAVNECMYPKTCVFVHPADRYMIYVRFTSDTFIVTDKCYGFLVRSKDIIGGDFNNYRRRF